VHPVQVTVPDAATSNFQVHDVMIEDGCDKSVKTDVNGATPYIGVPENSATGG